MIALGGVLIPGFVTWQRRREEIGTDPRVHLDLPQVPPLRSGLVGLFSYALGSRLSSRCAVRLIVRASLSITIVAVLALLATVQPDLADVAFAASMAVLGVEGTRRWGSP